MRTMSYSDANIAPHSLDARTTSPKTGRAAYNDTVPLVKPSKGSPKETFHGFWVALDCATGEIVWQTVSPLDGNMPVMSPLKSVHIPRACCNVMRPI